MQCSSQIGSDYSETLDFTKDTDNNWKKMIRDNEKEQKEYWLIKINAD